MDTPTLSDPLLHKKKFKPSVLSVLLTSIGLVIYSSIITTIYIVWVSHGQELGLGGLVYIGLGVLAAGISFIVSLITLRMAVDRRQFNLTVLFIAVLITSYPFIISVFSWASTRHYTNDMKKLQHATTITDCSRISVYFDWGNCIKKTLKSSADLPECERQGRTKHNSSGQTLELSCQQILSELQVQTTLQKAADAVDGIKGCTVYAQSNDFSNWKFCISAKGVSSRSAYEECYRQARLQSIPSTGYWPMGQYCGSFYKESFGH